MTEYLYKIKCPDCGAEWRRTFGTDKSFKSSIEVRCPNPDCGKKIKKSFESEDDKDVEKILGAK